MTALEQAWTLLKQRGYAPLRQESEDPQDYLSDDELAHEGLPVEAKDIPLEYDPRIEEQQRRAAEEIEAEGIDLPDGPSSAPPANIGMAGSLTPAPFRPDLERLRQSMTPLGQALARVRAGSGPRPLQFDQ